MVVRGLIGWVAGCGLLLVAGSLAAAEVDAPPDGVGRLIEQLGSSEYIVRQRAEKMLARMGFEAFDALKAAEDHDDIEIASRARYLSERIHIQWAREGDSVEVKQLFSGYRDLDDEERLARARQLITLPSDAGLAGMCRIIRFDKSQELSKRVALLLLEPQQDAAGLWKSRRPTIEREIQGSERTACQWLRTQLLSLDSAQKALDGWTALIEHEQRDSAASAPDVVLGLMRQKVALLKQMDRRDEAVALMIKMIDLEPGNPETLAELVDWLAKQQAWEVIDEVAKRFAAQFDRDAFLLYVLAEVRTIQGDVKQAEQLAERAKKLNGVQADEHFRVAYRLQFRGLYRWSEQEYREVIKLGPDTARTAVYSSIRLSELLHDEGQDQEAGEVLMALVADMDKNSTVTEVVQSMGREPGAIRSRAHYFVAAHQGSLKNFAEQRKRLDQAIRFDPIDADVLIAMHRLEGADPAYRKRTLELIRSAAAQFEQQIEDDPEDSTPYNQYAWLIGNTEGDYARAIRYSHKSLEIQPDAAGYLDTLGRCYYTAGDLKNAVKFQAQAVNIDPHSGLIRRQLELFERELAKSQEKQGAP
jgi:tetratricopeptide (TPR) repeat protein